MSAEPKRKRGLPLREIVIVIVLLVVLTILALPVVRNTMHATVTRTCQGNLKEWATILSMYSAENEHLFPPPHGYEDFGPASNAAGCSNIDDAFDFAPDLRLIFPDYANDYTLLACPDAGGMAPATMLGPLVIRRPALDPNTFAIAEGSCAQSGSITRPGAAYTYFGVELKFANDEDPQVSEEQARLAGLPATGPANIVAMLEQVQIDEDTDLAKARERRGKTFDRMSCMEKLGWPCMPYGGELASATILTLNDRGLIITEGPSSSWLDPGIVTAGYPTTAVLWDAIHQDASGNPVFNHREPEGCNVLFLDGHVEFKPYPGAFPVSKTFAAMRAVQ